MNAAHRELLKLSVEEKLHLVEELWDDIASQPDQVPVPEWHLAELDRREAELQRNPQAGSTWEEVKSRIKAGGE